MIPNFILKRLWLWCILLLPFSAIAQISGVTITPAGATASDTITITVNTNQICPTASANAGQSLSGASVVRLHAGLRVNGVNFVNTVTANSDAATTAYTGFTNLGGGIWQKRILPTAYFQPVTGTIEGITFVLNGGPTGGNPWEREGKVCGANGFPASNGDFIVPFPLAGAITGPRLGISLTLPTADTVVRGGNTITFRTNAVDSNGVAIDRVVFYADGNIVQTVRTAPYEFTWNTPLNPDTLVFTAEVFSVGGASRLSNAISVRVLEPIRPAIGIRLALPTTDTIVKVGDAVTLLALVTDTNNTGISGVEFFSNSNLLRTRITTPPYTLTLPKGDTATTSITARVFGINGESVLSNAINIGAERPYYYNSGVAIYSANGLASEPLDIRVIPVFTCPTPAVNAGGSLGEATVVRIHAGIRIGRNGGDFQRVVNAESSPAATAITGFTNVNGAWFKTLTPTEYFNITGTDTIAQMNFVLNGGPVNGNPWEREGKVCGSNGQPAAGAAGNFNVPFNLPAFQAPRIGVQISRPTVDTAVTVGNSVIVSASASDSAGRAITSAVLNVNGVPFDTITAAPYRFTWVAPSVNATFAITVTAFGANGASATSAIRNVVVSGVPIAPRLGISWVSPAADTAITINTGFTALVNAVDTTGQPISVTFLADGVEVGTDNEAPYTYTFNAGQFNDTVLLQARVNGRFSTSLLSSTRQVIISGEVPALFSGSGITVTPLGATGNDTITITVDPRTTCPTSAFSAGASLQDATIVRLHAGVRVGRNGTFWNNVVGATGTPENNLITGFTQQPNGTWVKQIVPSTYFNVPATDTVTGFSFVLNGGPDGSPWNREGKQCGVNGAPAAGGAGDFLINLSEPAPVAPILSVNISTPSTDTSVEVGSIISVNVQASDATNQRISRVVLWVNGSRFDTLTSAPYLFTYEAPATNGTYTIQAQVFGAYDSSAVSAVRTITVTGQAITPQLGINWVNPAADTTIRVETSFTANVNAIDTTGQTISVSFLVDGTIVATDSTAPYSYTYTAGSINDTVTLQARVNGRFGTTLLSSTRQVIVNGQILPIFAGSGVTITPLGATGRDTVTITVDPRFTCPTSAFNAGSSLQNATIVRLHAGVRVGRNGTFWNNVVGATGTPENNLITGFTQQPNGTWVKQIVPSTYFNVPATDTVTGFSFVLNGGPDGSPWNREGKQCGVNGAPAAGGAGDFLINLSIPAPTAPRLSATITTPTADTSVQVASVVNIRVQAIDSTSQRISRVVLWVNGERTDTVTAAPYNFAWEAPATNGAYTIQAQVFGASDSSAVSAIRTITVTGQAVTPRLSINWVVPAIDASVTVNTNYTAEVLATDTTGQPISVSFWIDGVQVSEVTTPPYTFSFNTGTVNDTLNLTARVNGVLGANLVSPNRQLIIAGQAASLFEGSGVRVTPAGATGNDTITITVDPRFTCPTPTANAATSLFGAPVIRLHSGVKVGRNGANFTRVVAANADSAQTALTGFTRQINGTWVKKLVPRTYYSVPEADTIVALNFVMNGGPVGGNPWAREGKVCGTNGQPAVGDAGNFFAPLALPPFTVVTPRIAVTVSLPNNDTIVLAGNSFPISVIATDSTNQAIERTILRVNGIEVANVLGGIINFNYNTAVLPIADTLRIQAEAIGAQGLGRFSNVIRVIVIPVSVKGLAAMGISVYPNPTSATLTINSKLEMVKSVQIKDVSGKVVFTASPNALQSELNVSELTNGFYLVEIATEKGTSVARIVKQ